MEPLNPRKRKMAVTDDVGMGRRFKILLPNGTSVDLTVPDSEREMSLLKFVSMVKDKYFEAWRHYKKMREINWKEVSIFLEDVNDEKIHNVIDLKNYNSTKCHILRLHDGSSQVAKTFENMWDLTPDTDLLLELPDEYTFETALADLIDNSLQAVWSNEKNKGKIIRVNLGKDKIFIFDNGPGMDYTDENSIVKWGKMGASLHRASKSQSIGGKPPYLMPFFGMFGYGGPIASMHLGRYASVSSKTKNVKKVCMLLLEREALLSTSSSKLTWKTSGGIRDPSEYEIRNSHESFTKVKIYEPKIKDVHIYRLQCHLKDIYFPYIQSDDMSVRGKTMTPIQFQVNGVDLTEIQGGEVAITNLHSCNGPEFVIQLHLSLVPSNDGTKSGNSREIHGANARLRFVYLPFTKGKENTERVLEKLAADGFVIRENFQTFSRVSVRRLGRLLPDARWTLLPFMDFRNKRGIKAQILKRCSLRVKCLIETDGGFKPTPSKTDLAHHNPFTNALKNLGNKISDKEKDVTVVIRKAKEVLTLSQLEREYQEWILQMHAHYDEEADSGEDQPVIIVHPANKKALGISSDVIRVHKVLNRKEKSWKQGQKIKVLKGACAGCHRTTVYATIEYFLLEGFEGDAGGEARIICREIDVPNENGCFLSVKDDDASLDIRSSLSLPLSVIDSEKLVAVESVEWENRLKKKQQISPSIYANHYEHVEPYELEPNYKSFEEKATRKSTHPVGKLRLLTGGQSEPLHVRIGSTFPTLHIVYYDVYNKQSPFHSIPDVTVQLETAVAIQHEVHGIKTTLSADKMTLEIKDGMITSNELNKIMPNYKVTLFIYVTNVQLSLTIPCIVYPGFPNCAELKPNITEDQLIPGFIFKELVLEIFDTYGNRVSNDLEVTLAVTGFNILDDFGMIRKVNEGRIDLGDLLKLTAGFGKYASISVMFENQTIFERVFSTMRRKLRIASEVPEFCCAGDHLENIDFEIVNPDEDVVDMKFHHNDKDGQYHMLTIKSDHFNAEESIRYTFKHGRCTVPSIHIPVATGTFCFEAAHSQYMELCLTVQITVLQMPIAKYVGQPPSTENSIMDVQEPPSAYHGNNIMKLVPESDYGKEQFQSICILGEKIGKVESQLNDWNEQKAKTEQEMVTLQEKVQPYRLGITDSSSTKDELMSTIRNMENSAVSVLCSDSTCEKPQNYFLTDLIGVVALIGTVENPALSRILAEYLGEDKMLGVIYRSLDAASSLEMYNQNGEIDYECALHAEASALGKAINKRFHVICIEDLRPYTGGIQRNDISQRRLALPYPSMPNGVTPEGFIGYAVNMVDVDINYLQTVTALGHGLRETVLFNLFKKLQVYYTRQSMVAASACIEDGAVSLDGGILRENGFLSLGYGNPSVYFPCQNRMELPLEIEETVTQIEEKKSDLRTIEERIRKLTKYREKYIKKFHKKKERYGKFMDSMEPMNGLLECKPEAGDGSNTSVWLG